MAQISGYKEELQDELQKTDPNSHASRLLAQEIDRLQKGDDRKDNKSTSFVDVHHNQPQNVVLNVRIPTREHPRFNFVGKLIGPKGATMKRLQEETGCKMSVLGKGSMRDKAKEEELRKEGGKKNAHLSEELHVRVEVFAEMAEGYRRLSGAITELRKFLIPTPPSGLEEEQGHSVSDVFTLLEAFRILLSQQQPPSPMPFPLSDPGSQARPQTPRGFLPLPRGPSNMQRFCFPRGPMQGFRGPAVSPARPMLPPGRASFHHGMPRGRPMMQNCPVFPFLFPPWLPMKKLRKPQPKPKRKPTPWYSSIKEEFHLLKSLRRQAERKWARTRNPEDRKAYVAAKQKYNNLIARAKAALNPPKEPKEKEEAATEPEGTKGESEPGVGESMEKSSKGTVCEKDDSTVDDSSDDGMVKTLDQCMEEETGNSGIKLQSEMNASQDCPHSLENNDDIHQQQMQDMGMYQEDGRAPARGGFRGGPAGRGGPPSAGRGAPMRGGAAPPGRGAPPPGRGAPRGGGAPLIRGTPPTRGRGGAPPPSRAPPAQAPAYDEYGYGNSERESGYDDGYSRREYAESSYAQRQRGGSGYDDGYSSRDYAESSYRNSGYAEDQGDSQYYGRSRREPSSSAAGGYETYSYDYGHGDSWGAGGSSYGPMKSSGGSGAPKPRSHPYSSGY